MVFNWFRRQYSDSKEQPQDKAASSAQPEPQPESDTSDRPEEQSQQQVAEDYLAWAKAAYKNIQAKQQTQTATTAIEPQPTEEIEGQRSREAEESQTIPTQQETSEVEISTTVALDAVTEELELLETVVAAEVATPDTDTPEVEKVATVTENAEAIAPETALESPEIPQPSQQEAVAQASPAEEQVNLPDSSPQEADVAATVAPVPFWARDDRQARLERLKATAIEESEPEVQPVVAVTGSATEEEIPGVFFDDGFLWSAEILASQGRRPEDVSVEEITWLKKLRQGLDKTRRNLINQLKAIVGQGPLNQDAVMEIESLLLQADVGVEATDYIIKSLQNKLREQALPPDAALAYLKQILRDMLNAPLHKSSYQATFAPEKETFNIWLITGVNGAGKTTTIGKIAHLAQKSGYKCLIGAADTFRAAAVQQVKVWGQRSGVEVVANPGQNTDPAAVVFDAIAAAKARGTELLLVDTAGRLQNKKNLMEELTKIRRIIDKKAPEAHVESLLVLDATLGQNGLRQAQVFSEAAKLSGVVLTKLDGTAKGGVALAVVQQLGLPIRFIGAGEGIEDLRPFSSYEFIEALLSG
ncbi:signal recognition particle-docking protein FtsY [Argonema antarcticum]|uniref:signal recognition particle-docking protein FtsY n=1 Tax=Argonema antarcticum TaxID=2942763 RepID=UPI002011093A|nr:signal recognition particle-docking protein FtsY [Argonema antarcticum]MCL1470847.1 signal recognition particle-docking protein FtsY [Argonema antarcticum A004/B2]